MVNIRFYNEEKDILWDDFVLDHHQGTFFHLITWKKVIEKTFKHKSCYLVAEKGKEVVGILPCFIIKSVLFGKCLVSNAFATYGGGLAEDDDILKLLMERAIQIASSEGLDYFEVRNLYGEDKGLVTKDLYYTFRREIYKDLEDNLKAIPRKSRRMVRVARDKYKLTCKVGGFDLLDEFYNIYARSVHNLGSPVYPKKLFKNLLQDFDKDCKIFMVYSSDKRPLAGVMTFFYKDEVLPYYGGSLFEGKKLAANDFMYWNVMKYGCEYKYKIFDFGRSKKGTGSFSFKKHWGFEPKPIYYQYHLNKIRDIPNVSPTNPRYQRKIQIWKKIPFFLTKLIGPHLVKYIP